MVIQSAKLDPDAQAYTDDEIVGKVNAAAVAITRGDAIDGSALGGVDSDAIAEGAANKYDTGVPPADLEDLPDGATRKAMLAAEKTKLGGVEEGATVDQTGAEIKTAYEAEADAYTDTKNTKLTGIEEGAQPDQSGVEMVTALEALGAGSRLGSDKIDQEADAKFLTDAEETKVVAIDQVYSNTEKTKLTGIEEGAETNIGEEFSTGEQTKLSGIAAGAQPDQTGAEVRDLIVGLADIDRQLILTDPAVGEFPVISLERDSDGKYNVKYDDVPIE